MGEDKYAAVVLSVGGGPASQPYYYRIPTALRSRVRVGSQVVVPLRSRRVRGWVVELVDECPVAETKEVEKVLGDLPAFGPELLELAKWMARTYLCPLGVALKALGPSWLLTPLKEEAAVRLAVPEEMAQYWLEELNRRAPKQAEVLARLLRVSASYPVPVEQLGADRRTLRCLQERGLVRIEPKAVAPTFSPGRPPSYPLTPAQRQALVDITEAVRAHQFRSILLHGVTGSGKTEVYLQAIAATLAAGRQAIFLVPEIALTPPMVGQLRERFGNQVAILHSQLSAGERRQAWHRLARGEIGVAVGARSAVFAPVPRLGLIVIDEEHETSYKQENPPRYHAREVAWKRAQLASAVLLMGSATPSLETYFWAHRGVIKLLTLGERVDRRRLPEASIVDMREELRQGNPGILSRYLEYRLEQTLNRGEQAVLFLNRRGYHTVLVCRQCGQPWRCRSCDISLTYHRQDHRLRCHYCGFSTTPAASCPACGSRDWIGLGTGTQRVEEELKVRWPRARILRLDTDVIRHRGVYQDVYEAFRKGEAEILLGTQMVAKGFNFPRVTLVGVINADVTLNLPDFRARERTFQLLTQVGGRAGRGEKPGEVVIQTYCPEDYSIEAASHHNYLAFYHREIEQRRRLGYPPFSYLLLIVVSAPRDERARRAAEELHGRLASFISEGETLLGPAPAPVPRLQGRYRYQMILKGRPPSRLRATVQRALEGWKPAAGVKITVDVNPLLLM
ncbi:MAG: replication restart helicase PriA [Moorellales bacterium]